MSTLKVTHLQNENGTGPAMSIAVGGGVTFAGISTFYGAIDLQTPTDLRVAAGATISGSTNTITASTNGEERVRITSGGNVNIGGNFTETSHPLNISDSTKPSLCLHTGTTQRADFSATTGITSIRSFANSPFTINVGGSGETEAFRITADGNVGIGTDTIGNISNRSQLVIGGSTGGLLDFNVGSDTEARIFATDGTGLTIRSYQSDGEIVFQTGGSTEQARITANGLKLASGNGINFSAYATSGNPSSNLLDDYEEGTWTPGVNTPGYTLSTAIGHYTKIGRLVSVNFRIAFSAVPATNSTVTITNYPFTNAASIHISGIVRESSNTGALYALQINANATQGGLNSMDGVANGSNRTIRTNEQMECSLVYNA